MSNKAMIEYFEAKRSADKMADGHFASDEQVEAAYKSADEKLSLAIAAMKDGDNGDGGTERLAESGQHWLVESAADSRYEDEKLYRQMTMGVASDHDPADIIELLHDVQLQEYISAAVEGRYLTGAALELEQELDRGRQISLRRAGQGIPIPLIVLNRKSLAYGLAPDREDLADSPTTIQKGDFETTMHGPVMPVFRASDIEFLGRSPLPVQAGATRVPVISDSADAATPTRGESVDASATSITVREFNAEAVTDVKQFYRRDLHTYPNLDRDLTMLMTGKVMQRLDDMYIIGSGSSGQPRGIFNWFKGTGVPGNPSAEATFFSYQSAFASQVDGVHAYDESDMRILVGVATRSHMRSKVLAQSGVDALEKLNMKGVRIRPSTRIPSISSKRQDAILALSEASCQRAFGVWIWDALYLVEDDRSGYKTRSDSLALTAFYDCGALAGVGVDDYSGSTNVTLDGVKRLRFQVQA